MLGALHAVECKLPSFDAEPLGLELAAAARSQVEIRHVRGAVESTYLVQAFNDELLMQMQLNVHRLVVSTACRPWMRLMLPLWRYASSSGASAPSMPAGSSAGAMRRSQVTSAGIMSRPIAMLSPVSIFSKTSSSSSIGVRHRTDDTLLHVGGRPMRHSPVATPRRFPGLEDQLGSSEVRKRRSGVQP
jgi:hypothetical protein